MQERSEKLQGQFANILKDSEVERKIELLGRALSKKGDLAEYAGFLQKFPEFFNAVDLAYSQYDILEEAFLQYEEEVATSMQALQSSSDKLNQVNSELDNLNIATSAMLDGLGQGLLFFDKDGICSPIHSKACSALLETDPAGQHIADILKASGVDRQNIVDWINIAFSGNVALGFDELSEIAPRSYAHSGNLFIGLEYRPLRNSNDELKNILVIATDFTKEQQAKEQVAENISKALGTLRIARSRNYFLRFISQFRELFMENDFAGLEGDGSGLDQFKRDVHTLKGLSGTFHLDDLTRVLHAFENDINNLPPGGDVLKIVMDYYYKLNENFNSGLQFAKEVLGDDFEKTGSTISVQTQKIFGLAQELKQKLEAGSSTPDEITQMILQELIAVPIREIFVTFDMQLQELADRTGKMVYPCFFTGENFSVLPGKYEGVVASLVHVARNIIDHAIDEPEMRQQFGKFPKGGITIHTEKIDDKFTITITDDGNGIDTDLLRSKLADKIDKAILASMSDEDVIQHIFDDNISTKEQVSQISGRGVGMSAVKAEVENLGGNVRVTSTIGEGTSLHMILPFILSL